MSARPSARVAVEPHPGLTLWFKPNREKGKMNPEWIPLVVFALCTSLNICDGKTKKNEDDGWPTSNHDISSLLPEARFLNIKL